VIARTGCNGVLHVSRAPPVLPELDRSLRRVSDLGVAAVVVGARRFLNPGQALVVERPDPVERLVDRQALVVVDHQFGFGANRCADRSNRLQVLCDRAASDLQLDAAETARHRFAGLLSGGSGPHRPQARVGRDRPRPASAAV
jgi:hypothetical protein